MIKPHSTKVIVTLVSLIIFLCTPLDAGTKKKMSKIDKDLLKPGAEIILDLPELGPSGRRKTQAVQTMIVLPKNYDPKLKHPVLFALGGGYGGIQDAKRYHQILEGQNYICISVDYCVDKVNGCRDPNFENVMHVLKMLAKVTKFDSKNMVIAGTSSGAYNISDAYDSKNGKMFLGYILVIGGMEMTDKSLKKKAVLLIAGENDKDKASAGRPRVDVQVSNYNQLLKKKVNATMIMQKGVGHGWKKDYDQEVRNWFYQKLPTFSKYHAYYLKMKKSKSESAKKRYANMILKSKFILPYTKECEDYLQADAKVSTSKVQ